jgi:hypothetical protein
MGAPALPFCHPPASVLSSHRVFPVNPGNPAEITASFGSGPFANTRAFFPNFPHVGQWNGTSWTNITGNLSSGSVDHVVYDAGNLVAATDGGVFGSSDGGATWSAIGTGLPAVQVQDLYVGSDGLYAVTHGRGAWKLPPAPPTVAAVTPGVLHPGMGATLTVTGTSFDNSSVASLSGAGITATTTLISSTTLHVSATVSSGAALGLRSLTVTNAGPLSATLPNAVVVRSTAGEFHALSPVRILDTRDGTGGFSSPIGPGASIDVRVAGVPGSGVPATGVNAVILNVTATNPTGFTYLTVYPTGATKPLASNLNVVPGQTAPNLVTVALGTGGKVTVYNNGGNTDVVADVAGWYGSNTAPAGAGFAPAAPFRVFDTRSSQGGPGPLMGGGTLGLDFSSILSPAIKSLVLNVTVTDTTTNGFLTVWPGPCPQGRPLASNLNFTPGQTVPNLVTVPMSTDGHDTVCFFNSAGSTDVVVDLFGGYDDGTQLATGQFQGTVPHRLLDTRDGTGGTSGPVGAGVAIPLQVAGDPPVPGTAFAAVMNVTVTQPTAPSFLTVWPDGITRPLASNLNYVAGLTVPNLVVVPIGGDGKVDFYNNQGSTHVIADVVGWFVGPNAPLASIKFNAPAHANSIRGHISPPRPQPMRE